MFFYERSCREWLHYKSHCRHLRKDTPSWVFPTCPGGERSVLGTRGASCTVDAPGARLFLSFMGFCGIVTTSLPEGKEQGGDSQKGVGWFFSVCFFSCGSEWLPRHTRVLWAAPHFGAWSPGGQYSPTLHVSAPPTEATSPLPASCTAWACLLCPCLAEWQVQWTVGSHQPPRQPLAMYQGRVCERPRLPVSVDRASDLVYGAQGKEVWEFSFSGYIKAGLRLGGRRTWATEPLWRGRFYSQWVAQSLEETPQCHRSGASASEGQALSPPRETAWMWHSRQLCCSSFCEAKKLYAAWLLSMPLPHFF